MAEIKSCLFCRIVKKEIPSAIVYEDAEWVAFKDIHPQAPVHVLIVPKKHFDDHLALKDEDRNWIGGWHALASRLAKDLKIEDGFRLVVNCKERAGQTVNHLHMHLMGGRDFSWPPG